MTIGHGDLTPENTIEGGTDGTTIGNISDRLKVTNSATTGTTYPVIPADLVVHNIEHLENGGSADMTVDGSTVNVEFVWNVPGGETWYLDWLSFVIVDPGTMDTGDFGSITGSLTNGLKIEFKTNGTVYEYINLTDNLEIAHTFVGRGGKSTGEESSAFLDEDDLFIGNSVFNPQITLKGSTSDFVKATVRDDLTDLQNLCVSIGKWRTV